MRFRHSDSGVKRASALTVVVVSDVLGSRAMLPGQVVVVLLLLLLSWVGEEVEERSRHLAAKDGELVC